MVEESPSDHMRGRFHFDAGPLGLDLYRLLCLVPSRSTGDERTRARA
jgi:hypothetical protein